MAVVARALGRPAIDEIDIDNLDALELCLCL
jgi:hypothetical protein